MREINLDQSLYANGNQLLVSNHYFTYLVEGFVVENLTLTNDHNNITTLDIHLRSCGPLKQLSKTEAQVLFRNVNDLSVDDLLKEIHARLEERDQALTDLPALNPGDAP